MTRAYFSWLRQRRLETLFKQFPDALAMIVRAVRVGIPVSEAIRTVARDAQMPTAREFGRMADRLTVGMPLDQALSETAAHVGLPEYRFFATALALQAQTGGGLTDTLENLADVIRKRVALQARAAALSSEAKTSAAILAALPFFAGGALFLTSPDYLLVLISEPRGQQILGAAALMLTMGILVMRSMIRRALRS
jgi:tight adherence protein B